MSQTKNKSYFIIFSFLIQITFSYLPTFKVNGHKMVIKSKQLCRHVLENQHKLIKFIFQQNVRLCSGKSAQPLAETKPNQQENIQIKTIIPSVDLPLFSKIEHEADIGHLFKARDMTVQLANPSQCRPKPEYDDLIFGKHFSDHMLKIAYHKRLGGWQTPSITPMENIVLHPAAKVFHYAMELFEGMKAYRGVDDKIRFFRPDMNMARMNHTAQRSGLPTFDGDEFMRCLSRLVSIDQEWVPHHPEASLYIRPTLIGIEPTLGVASSDSALLYTILSPVGSYFKKESSGAVSLLADPNVTRAWPGGVGDKKMGSNYAPTIKIQKEAAGKGLHHVLWLYGEDHQLTEVGIMNIMMFYINDDGEKELITPPLDGLILPGITRHSILHMAREWGEFKVSENKFTMPMVRKLLNENRLLELFGIGTALLICPIERIHYVGEDLHIPTMKHEQPLFRRLLKKLTGIQYGKEDHRWGVTID